MRFSQELIIKYMIELLFGNKIKYTLVNEYDEADSIVIMISLRLYYKICIVAVD